MINAKVKRKLKAALPSPQFQELFRLIEQKRQAVRPLVRKLRRSRA